MEVTIHLPLEATHALARAGAELEDEVGSLKVALEGDFRDAGRRLFPDNPNALVDALIRFYSVASQPLAEAGKN